VPLLGYALLIGTAAAVLWVWSPDGMPAALLGGGAALMALVAAAVAVGGRERGAPAVRPIPDYSFPVVAIAFALCTMLVGAYLGLYLILVGGGVMLLGVGGLLREARAERRALRRAQRERAGDAG
jgi:hypothetical protein